MVPVADASPVLIGNKVESIIPYHMSDEFVVTAKENGKVVERTPDYVVVKYASGKNYAIDIGNRVQKNASGGFYINNDLRCDLQVGKTFKKGDVLAFNDTFFAKNENGKGVSMKLGVLTKIASLPNWDMYEDSVPVTRSLANRLATNMIAQKSISLTPDSLVDYMVSIGDKVKTGETLIRFLKTQDDEVNQFLATMREDTRDQVLEETKNVISSKYTGEIADIRIFSTVPVEDMSPSLQKIFKEYQARIKRKTDLLDKYKNPDDLNNYKAGQIISETADVIDPSVGKIHGQYAENAVVIEIYVRYKDIIAKGDKICHEFALKGIASHVIEDGKEPYSEYRPDEEISTLVGPLAIGARKVPSIFLAMFGNKCLIELKRQLADMYLKSSGTIADRRKKFMSHLTTCMDLLDPTKENSATYKKQFNPMTDAQFDKWCKDFFKDNNRNWYLEIVEYERDLTIENIEKCANYMKVPLLERVALPYAMSEDGTAMVTPYPVPVGYVHDKRMPQTLLKKSKGSLSTAQRNAKTGQVIGDDKNARQNDTETYSLIAMNAINAEREFMGPRADDVKMSAQMYNQIAKNGYVSLEELKSSPKDKIALNTFDVYFAYQMFLTNLITPLDRLSTDYR